jgi:L1 cell adhesion molecule like protein
MRSAYILPSFLANLDTNCTFARRLIGRKYNDPDVQADKAHFSFKLVEKDTKPYISVIYKGEEKTFSPEE